MKLLCILPTLSMASTLGAAPYLNQLVEAMKEKADVTVVESRGYSASVVERAYNRFVTKYRKPYKYAKDLCKNLKHLNFDVILIIHDFRWLREGNVKLLSQTFKCRIFFYDLEAPLNFSENMTNPQYGVSPWRVVDLSNVDGVIIPSRGACDYMKKRLNARRVLPLYFSVSPSWYPNERLEDVYDVSYLGMSTYYREESIREMVTVPSRKLTDMRFFVSSRNRFDFGLAEVLYQSISFSDYTRIPRQTRINLSITRKPFTEVFASSVSRPFELAAMKCCIVSNPCLGMEEWFEEGKEIMTVENAEEACEIYKWLVKNEKIRREMGEKAYEKVIKQHTISKRVQELMRFLEG